MSWLGTWANRLKLTIDKDLIDTANLTDFPVMVHLSAASGIGDVDASCVFDELGSDANRKKIAFTSSDGTTQLYAEIERYAYGDLNHIDSDDQGDNAYGVWGDGNFVYLANDTGGLHTYSVDGSGNLTHIDSDDQGDNAYGVWGDGTFIYLANGYGGLHTYSVDGSGNLTHIDSDDQGDLARSVWGDGTFIYLANYTGGLHTYSVDGSGNLTHIDSDDQGDIARSVWGDGNFVYLANDTGGLHTYSVDGSGNLTHIDSDDQGDIAYSVWGDGTFIYLANGYGGLHTYSVDGSGNLTHIDSDDQGDMAYGVWGDGTFIYLANYTGGLHTYSVDGSGNLTHIDSDDQGDHAYSVWGDGTFIYLANYAGGLHAYSVVTEAWLHVKVPSVAYDADTILYLYYDSTQADNTAYIGDTGDTVTHNVWDSNFKAVYHMAQDPNGDATDAIKDSTSNANDGTPAGSMTTADLVDGKVGKGIDFDGNGDYITFDDAGAGAFDVVDAVTIEATVKRTSHNADGEGIVVKQDTPDNNMGDYAIAGSSTDERILFALNDNAKSINANNILVNATWVYLAGTYDKTNMYLYADGAQKATDTYSANITTTYTKILAGRYWGSGDPAHYSGIIDEVRISSTARSAAWIKATYHSLWDSLITFGQADNLVSATTASLAITSNAATIIGATTVWTNAASLSIIPYAATVGFGAIVQADSVPLVITSNAATILYDVNVSATAETLTLIPNVAAISNDINVQADSASLALTPQNATVVVGVFVDANTAALTLTPNAATILYDVNVLAETDTLHLYSSWGATISYDINVLANTTALVSAGLNAQITYRITSMLSLINTLKMGSTLSLVNSLNIVIESDIRLVLDVLSKIEGIQTRRLDIEELVKFNDTLNLINHILDADSGITQGDYYFLRSHGL